MPAAPCSSEMPTIAPTTACELETGTNGMEGRLWLISQPCSPFEANMNSTMEWAMTATKALVDESRPRVPPTVIITPFE